MTEPTPRLPAYRRRFWVNRELVDADLLNDFEARVDEGIRNIPVEVSDPIVADIVNTAGTESVAALKTRVEGWVADGTIPAGGEGGGGTPVTVTEVQPGAYALDTGATSSTIYGLTAEQKLPGAAKADLSTDLANSATTVGKAVADKFALKSEVGAKDADIATYVADPATATGAAVASVTAGAVGSQVPLLSMETIRADLENPYSLVRLHVLDILAEAAKAPAAPNPAVRRNVFFKTEAPAGGLPYNASNLTVGPETVTKDGVVLTRAATSNFYGMLEAALFSANATILTAGQRYMVSYYVHNPGTTDLWFFTRALSQGTSNGHGLKLVKQGETKRVWGIYQASSATSFFPFADPALGYGGGTATSPKLYFPGANTGTVVEAYVGGFQIEAVTNNTIDGVAVIGDSTMAGGAAKKDERSARESSTFLAGLTNFQTFNRAVGGERTDQMDARWATDITPLAGVSKFVIIQGGINDIAQGTRTLEDIRGSFRSMVAKAESDGLVPIVLTCTPTSTIAANSAMEQKRKDLNTWLKRTYGGRCIDIAPVVADPANPTLLNPVWAGDGIHYTMEGKRKVGEKLAAWPYWNMPKPSPYQPVTGATWTAPTA